VDPKVCSDKRRELSVTSIFDLSYDKNESAKFFNCLDIRVYCINAIPCHPPDFQRPSCCLYNCHDSCGEIVKHLKIPSANFWQFEFLTRLKGSFK
jgi:hypothetical protein